MKTPNYYAVIPANVRYDPRLKPNEKLLYGEITALSQKDGYCFATNRYFADLYKVTKATASAWVSHLRELGYIGVDMVMTQAGEIDMRRITILPENPENFEYPTRKKGIPPPEKAEGTIDNNTSNNNTPLPPQEDSGFFERFWEAYPKRKGKEAARRAFRKLNADEALMETMLCAIGREKQSAQWRENGGKYIPYPATWLNQRRWEDEPDGPEDDGLPDYLRTYL